MRSLRLWKRSRKELSEMNQQLLEVKRERFHLLNPNVYILQGTFPKEYELAAYLDSVRIEARMEDW